MSDATVERMRELLDYDLGSGAITWKVYRGSNARAGQVAGNLSNQGYICIKVDGCLYKAQRLAWLLAHGKWPDGEIDHIDGTRPNNALANLRDVDKTTNRQNQRSANQGTQTGVLGVTPYRKKFVSQISIAGRVNHIGVYDTAGMAHAAYLKTKRQLHKGNNL